MRGMVSHFMVFYFAALAIITPPVAPASIVGAGIAGETFMRTAVKAVRLGAPLFVLPLAFATYPELICVNSQSWSAIFLVGIGLISISYSLNSPKKEWNNILIRVLFFALGGFILFYPMFFSISRISIMVLGIIILALLGRDFIIDKFKR